MVPEFHVENKGLTLNGHTVPVVTKRMILSDTLSLSISLGVRLPDSLELDLLSFGPSGDMSWLCKSLTVPDNNPGRWWAYCSVRLPLLTEIRESIKNLHVWKRQYQHLKEHIILSEPEAVDQYLGCKHDVRGSRSTCRNTKLGKT